MNRVETISEKAAGNNQKLKLFIRGKAMSGAPIISGIIQLARPTKAGITAPKTITRPCMVVIWLKNAGSTMCSPGWNSSARITMAKEPPSRNMAKLNHRYSVPISLWLVVSTQRIRPLAGPWAACSSWPPWPWSSITALMSCLLQTGERLGPGASAPTGSANTQRSCSFAALRLLQRQDFLGCDHVALVVAPGITLVGHDGGDIDFRQLFAEGRHGRARLAEEHPVQVILLGTGGDFRALECREHRRQALALGLVTGHAGGVVDLVAALLELVEGPLLAGQFLELGRLGLAIGQPAVVVGLGPDIDHHRHEAVVLAAQFGALPTVDARLVDPGPGFVEEPRDGVTLDRKGRHPPGMDHVGGGHQETHLGAHRQDQRLVDFQQVVFALGRLVMHLFGGSGQVAEELDILAQVFVVPFPLVAGDLDIDVRLTGVVHLDQRGGRGNRHHHQDQQGYDGPEDFHRGAFMELGRDLASGASVNDHRPEHRTKHDNADHHTDPENGHVQIKDLVTDFRRSRRHIHGPGGMRLTEYRPQQEAHPDSWMSHHCGFPLSFLLSRRLSPAAKGMVVLRKWTIRPGLQQQPGVIS